MDISPLTLALSLREREENQTNLLESLSWGRGPG